MGKQTLMLWCRLENVDNLRLPSDMDWHFILQWSQWGEKTDNEIYFNPIEELDIEVGYWVILMKFVYLCFYFRFSTFTITTS